MREKTSHILLKENVHSYIDINVLWMKQKLYECDKLTC